MTPLPEKRTTRTLFQHAIKSWNDDNCMALGASLAYYAIFSLFPLLLIMLSIIGFLYSSLGDLIVWVNDITNDMLPIEATPDMDAKEQIFGLVRESVSDQAATEIQHTLENLEQSRRGAGLIGFGLLFLSASGAFGQLDRTFNIIWKVNENDNPKSGVKAQAIAMVQKKLFSFMLVIGCAILLFICMISGIVIKAISRMSNDLLPGQDFLWSGVHLLVSFLILALTFMLLFKYLPDVTVRWKDVMSGGFLTAFIFAILLQVGSLYIAQSNFQSYGAVGGVMAFMLWIYLSSMVLFFGGEFTHSYAHFFGSRAHVASPPTPDPSPTPAPQPAPLPPPRFAQADDPVRGSAATAAGISFLIGMLAMQLLNLVGLVVGGMRLLGSRRPKEHL